MSVLEELKMIRDYQLSDQSSISQWWELESLDRFVERPSEIWSQYVTENNNVICKCLEEQQVRCIIQADLDNENAYLCIVTHPHYRHCGYGKQLLSALQPELENRGVRQLVSFIESDNSVGQAFASSLDWFTNGELDNDGFYRYQKNL